MTIQNFTMTQQFRGDSAAVLEKERTATGVVT